MNVIYIDVLIILNLYVTYFLIKAMCAFLHKKIKNIRVLSGSLFGAVSSLVILLPELPLLINILIKITLGLIIVLICFGYGEIKGYLRHSLIFIIMNLLFAGMMMVIWLFSSPLSMFYNNGVAYFDISFAVITISTALAYGVIKLLRYIIDSRMVSDRKYNLTVKYNGMEVNLNAFPDTGNTLTDYFSGMPVIICDKSACGGIIPEELDFENLENKIIKGVRLLPFSTVGSSGLMPVFKPDSITITESNGSGKVIDALVGISKERLNKDGVNALFNPKLLI